MSLCANIDAYLKMMRMLKKSVNYLYKQTNRWASHSSQSSAAVQRMLNESQMSKVISFFYSVGAMLIVVLGIKRWPSIRACAMDSTANSSRNWLRKIKILDEARPIETPLILAKTLIRSLAMVIHADYSVLLTPTRIVANALLFLSM